MNEEHFEVGDHVRIVNYLANNKMPVGLVESFGNGMIYVHTPVSDETEDDRCVYECFHGELVKITEQEYFKLILAGANIK